MGSTTFNIFSSENLIGCLNIMLSIKQMTLLMLVLKEGH